MSLSTSEQIVKAIQKINQKPQAQQQEMFGPRPTTATQHCFGGTCASEKLKLGFAGCCGTTFLCKDHSE